MTINMFKAIFIITMTRTASASQSAVPVKISTTARFDFIIDVGGDDVYNIDNDEENKDGFGNGLSCIIDLAGNDYYTTKSNFALAGALFCFLIHIR